ncbi:MAG: Clp1/GlmU family protein [Armatimonadota bacterium]
MTNTPQAPREQIRISRQWLDLVKQLPEQRGRIMVIGSSDSGKTTLCRWLLSKLPVAARPALVDSDVGQSTVGPPGCVGWRFAGQTDCQYTFTGDVTPASNPMATLAATCKAVRDAETAGAGLVLMDTSGYLSERGGFELKSAKLDLLAPLHAIILGDSPEIKRLLAGWHRDPRLTIHRTAQSEVLTQKTRAQRTQWRQERFAEALAGGNLRKVALAGKELSGLITAAELKAAELEPSDLQGLLVAFHDLRRRTVCLGLLQALDLPNQAILVRAPQAAEQAAGIAFGVLKLTTDGQEMGRII